MLHFIYYVFILISIIVLPIVLFYFSIKFCNVKIAVANLITSIPVETILNTHNFITCCVHLHIDTNSISIYTPRNASHCLDLLSLKNILGSGPVDVVAGMHNKILSVMSRKRARGLGDSSSALAPQKRNNVGPSKAPVPALPLPPPQKNGGDKLRDKSPEVNTQSGDRASLFLPRDQGDYLTPYQKDYTKSVGPKMVKDIESMSIDDLASSV